MEARNLVPKVVSAPIDTVFKNITSEKITHSVVSLFLVLYAGLAAPKLPKRIAVLFKESWFRFFILSLIAYMSTRDTSVAILATVAFVVTLNTLSKQEAKEHFSSCMPYQDFKKLGGTYVKGIQFNRDTTLATDPADSYSHVHKQKKLKGRRMILKAEEGMLSNDYSNCAGRYAEMDKFPYEKYRTQGLNCPSGKLANSISRSAVSETQYCDNDKPEIEDFEQKKNEKIVKSKESTTEDFSENSCTTFHDKGYFYNYKTIKEEDAQTCQGGRDWAKEGPLYKKPRTKKGKAYLIGANEVDSNDSDPYKGSTLKNCSSSSVSYGGEFWNPAETSVLGVNFSESPPEEFNTDPSEVSSEVAMTASDSSRL